MPRVITLPVRCSTVKKGNQLLPKVIWYECIIASIVNIIYDIVIRDDIFRGFKEFNIWGMSRVADHMPFPLTLLDGAVFVSTCASIIIVLYLAYPKIVATLQFVSENWPHLECIRDEPEEKV